MFTKNGQASRYQKVHYRYGKSVANESFSAQCDHCEKFFFKSEVRQAMIQSRKTGEKDLFDLCVKCRSDLRDRLAEDAGKAYGISGDVYACLETLFRSTVQATNASKGRKTHTISVQDLVELWSIQGGLCAMTGRALDPIGDGASMPSVDRINSKGGYVKENIHLVCQIVNFMKNDYPMVDFIEVCKDVARHKAILAIAA